MYIVIHSLAVFWQRRLSGFLLVSQETPDPPEALRCMPSLQLADIPTQASTVPTAVAEEAGVSVLRHELFTNDVLYLEAALDLRPVPPSLLHLVPLFCRCATPRRWRTAINQGQWSVLWWHAPARTKHSRKAKVQGTHERTSPHGNQVRTAMFSFPCLAQQHNRANAIARVFAGL